MTETITTSPTNPLALPDTWELVRVALDARRVVFLHGPAGTGKTFAGQRFSLRGRDVYSVTLTPETPSAELRGMYMPKGAEFVWSDGVLIRAMREGARLVVNEVSHAGEDVLAFLYPVLESTETAAITLPTGETVRPADGFQCVVTDNHGLAGLPQALQSRLSTHVEIPLPHPDSLNRLPERYQTAAIRSFNVDEPGRDGVSMRHWHNVAELVAGGTSEPVAFALTFGRDAAAAMLEAVNVANDF